MMHGFNYAILSIEKKEVIPILKCKDQSAKFHLTVKLTPLAELEHQLEK